MRGKEGGRGQYLNGPMMVLIAVKRMTMTMIVAESARVLVVSYSLIIHEPCNVISWIGQFDEFLFIKELL